MRLNFNILWVEDNKSNVMSQFEKIERLIREEGFRLQVEFAYSIESAKGYLSDDIYGDHIDLILMDYDLGAGGKGDEGLLEVRNKFRYKDIVFYSSQAENLLKMVEDKHVQGVFCSTRDDLPDTVVELFEVLVKKVLDIDHSRGIVMGATSDIDQYVMECLIRRFDNGGENIQKVALDAIAKHIKQKARSFQTDSEKITAAKHPSDLEKFHHIYTSKDKLRLLNRMLKTEEKHIELVPKITRYHDEILDKRNALGHVQVQVKGFSRKLFDKDNNELTSGQMKTLRQELLEFQELFEKLSEQLNSFAPQDQ